MADPHRVLRHGLTAGLWLLSLLCLPALAQTDDTPQETAPAADDEATLDRRLSALRAKVCEADAALCKELKAFAGAHPPCLPQGERLTVGQAQLIGEDGGVTPAEYFVLRTQRVRDVTLVQIQHVYSENEQEKQAAEALILAIQAGTPQPDNLLYRYVQTQRDKVPELMAQREGQTLVVRGEGPTVFLRQAGKQLFAALPAGVRPSGPAQAQGGAGVLFATLPAPASCQ